jgi:hypothetical protein
MGSSLIDEIKKDGLGGTSRRTFLKRATFVAGAAALGLAGYSGLIEPNEIDIRRIELRVERLPLAFDQFQIVLISDLHFGPYTGPREIRAAVQAANRLKPDMVAILGDFVTEPLSGSKQAGARKAEPCAQVLSELRSRGGTFAILGNHDYATDPDFVADALSAHGIKVLRNRSHVIEENGSRLWLIGVNDAMSEAAQLDTALAGVPAEETRLLLVHEPDFADYASRYGISTQFSGHSHGGQVRVPGLRPLWLPGLAQKYYDGYYRIGNLQLYTNRGIGTVGVPFRFCCPPEVTLVKLRSA